MTRAEEFRDLARDLIAELDALAAEPMVCACGIKEDAVDVVAGHDACWSIELGDLVTDARRRLWLAELVGARDGAERLLRCGRRRRDGGRCGTPVARAGLSCAAHRDQDPAPDARSGGTLVDLAAARQAALDWFERELGFAVDAHELTDDIDQELRRILGSALHRPALTGASVLSIQQAAAFIAGQR